MLKIKYSLNKIDADELEALLTKIRPLAFTHSKQLSSYIIENRLGYCYPNISGIVRMKEKDKEWEFRGGFPPKIYSIICQELGLSNEGTNAKPIKFMSFNDLDSLQ